MLQHKIIATIPKITPQQNHEADYLAPSGKYAQWTLVSAGIGGTVTFGYKTLEVSPEYGKLRATTLSAAEYTERISKLNQTIVPEIGLATGGVVVLSGLAGLLLRQGYLSFSKINANKGLTLDSTSQQGESFEKRETYFRSLDAKSGVVKRFDIQAFRKYNNPFATGCTEPGACGFAAAIAVQVALGNKPIITADGSLRFDNYITISPEEFFRRFKKATIKTDIDIDKNSEEVFIAGTAFDGKPAKQGIPVATAMGFFCDPRKELDVFNGATGEIAKAAEMIQSKVIQKSESSTIHDFLTVNNILQPALNIELTLEFDGRTVFVRLNKEHAFVKEINMTCKGLKKGYTYKNKYRKKGSAIQELPKSLSGLYEIVQKMSDLDREYYKNGLQANLDLAYAGFKRTYGNHKGDTLLRGNYDPDAVAGVHHNPESIFDLPLTLTDLAKMTAESATAARMGGEPMPAFATGGSGNQGIGASSALKGAYEILTRGGSNRDKLLLQLGKKNDFILSDKIYAEAALYGSLVARLTSERIGMLGAVCGCGTKSNIASAAALVYAFSDHRNPQEVVRHINDAMNLPVFGLLAICDGAKQACSGKINPAVGLSVETAIHAIKGERIPDEGLVRFHALDTVDVLSEIVKTTLKTDLELYKAMLKKRKLRSQQPPVVVAPPRSNDDEINFHI